jgi:hypothetical protein
MGHLILCPVRQRLTVEYVKKEGKETMADIQSDEPIVLHTLKRLTDETR